MYCKLQFLSDRHRYVDRHKKLNSSLCTSVWRHNASFTNCCHSISPNCYGNGFLKFANNPTITYIYLTIGYIYISLQLCKSNHKSQKYNLLKDRNLNTSKVFTCTCIAVKKKPKKKNTCNISLKINSVVTLRSTLTGNWYTCTVNK